MSVEEIQKGALQLLEDQRAKLAGQLFESPPATPIDDDGVEEAKRRSTELDHDPSASCRGEAIRSEIRQ